jgi:polysaccharide export outer membrane protein
LRLAATWPWALAAALLAGCSHARLYQPGQLPAQYLAAPTENVQTIDLSRLATYGVSNELIDRGDVLEVTIETGYAKDRETPSTYPVRVADDGAANVPLVGRVPLAGLELDSAEQAIKAAAVERGLFRNPAVTVVMKKQRVNKITVLGAVSKPGTYELPRGNSNLLQALVQAGGLSKEAGTDVEIRRPALRSDSTTPAGPAPPRVADGPQTELTSYTQPPPLTRPASSLKVNLVVAARQGSGGQYLDDGDVVMVEKRQLPPIHVIGLVHKPGQFELPPNQDLHLLDAIALAGGRSMQIADRVHLIRRVPDQEQPIVVEISLREAKRRGQGNLRLGPGDVVSVEETPATVVFDAMRSLVNFGFGTSVGLF